MCVCRNERSFGTRGENNTHTLLLVSECLYPITLFYLALCCRCSEAAKMTIKKSKTVAFESHAGDLTALCCMNDWMIAVVLAILAIMSVWAAMIIYRSIQTLKGPRRKVDDDTILEPEKDGKETTNEEAPLSCVESTEETAVVPEALENWDGEGWRRAPMIRIPTINEDVEPIERIPTTTNENVEPIETIPTTNEDVEPIERIPSITNEDLETIKRRTTEGSDGPYAERQIEFHLCSPPEEHCGGLCQDDSQSQTDHTQDKEEQTTTSHRSLGDLNSQSGQMKDTEVYNPEEEGLKEVELRDDCQREGTEAPEASRLHASANESPEDPEDGNETLPDTMLTDSDLREPDHVCSTEMQEVKYPDDDMTSHVATEMILSDTDPPEPLPGHLCGTDIGEVVCSDDYVNSLVTIMPLEERPDMIMTDNDVNKRLADFVHEEAVECSDDRDSHVAFANTQESPENLTLSDADLQEYDQLSVTEIQEVQCPGADMMTSHVEVIYEKTRTMEGDMQADMEAMVEDLCSHFPQVDDDHSAGFEYCDVAKREGLDVHGNDQQQAQSWNTTGIDPTERMTRNPQELFDKQHLNKQPDSLRSDLNRDCVLHDNVMEGLSREPMEARDTHVVSERKGEGVSTSIDTQVEKSCQKVEINIMEATMDYNEWMTVSGTDAEVNTDTPWVKIIYSSVECSTVAEHHPTETRRDSHYSTMADAPASKVKETGTTPVSLDGDLQGNKKMAAVPPIIPHAVQVRFCIHYHTQSPWQELAVTGNQPELGSWTAFVPLERGQDGFWASWVALPAERLVEWKFVLVENGEIHRWEESGNRHLETGHGGGEVTLNRWWGYL
ncbi:hypothetical protein J4Q44_G00076600 [Coregonus suidteri]|uniref:CBM20 domain-containing protein n=1 Tax=Coregonus suidteri TaxID=861788 RepID=A0AAN8M856_9TELE